MGHPTQPSDLGQELIHLVQRAVEGRLIEGEVDQLWALCHAVTNDRREPLTTDDWVSALEAASPANFAFPKGFRRTIARNLQNMVVGTKLPHPVWKD